MFGEVLKLSIAGQSHSAGIGMILDGLPAGFPVDMEALAQFLKRRAPGQNPWSTPRKEADLPEFLSGLVENVTCGAPLMAVIRNTNTRSGDYAELREYPRPSHADYAAQMKYQGFQDVAGGGHFSGRLTAPLCVAGGICLQLLQSRGIQVMARIAQIHGQTDESPSPRSVSDWSELSKHSFPVLHEEAGERMKAEIEIARMARDSVGGIIECAVFGVPAGVGDPMFDRIEGKLSAAVFGIPAIRGIEFGNGFDCVKLYGSENNDPFCVDDQGKVIPATNRQGGMLGGISSGMPIVFRVAVKPTPSISMPQQTASLQGNGMKTLEIHGRHDPCIVPRAVPVVEAATALALLDLLLKENR